MSWDVVILKADGVSSMEDLLEVSEPECLGEAEELHSQLSGYFSGLDWANPGVGQFDSGGMAFQFRITEDGPVESIMLHVYGTGDAVSAIATMCKKFGWLALDCSTSELIDLDNPSDGGWEGFQEFRDQCFGDLDDRVEDE